MIPLIVVLASVLAQETAAPATKLDYAFFRDRVQPIFLAKRPGHARCVVCHDHTNPRLQPLAPGEKFWTEEQSQKNFKAWQYVVVPGNPMASRLCLHPLAASAGGDSFHPGGKHFKSRDDPEWKTLADWVNGKTEGSK